MRDPVARERIAVVGAGIIGCLVARELAERRPGAVVTLLDRDIAGSGASRLSAGTHIPRGYSDRFRRMTAYSQDWYEKLAAADPSLPIHPVAMHVVTAADELPPVYIPGSRPTRVPGIGAHMPAIAESARVWSVQGGHYADVHGLSRSVARELRGRIAVREGVQVTAVEPAAAEVTLRLGTDDDLVADHVVLAPGPWLDAPAWRDLLAPVGARVKKVVALHVDEPVPADAGVVVFQDEDAFLMPLAGHWLFSYTCRQWDVDPDTVTRGLTARDVIEANDVLHRCVPGLPGRYSAGRVFCDAYSAHGEPVVTHVGDRIVFAGAASGFGYRLAPAIADEVAQVIPTATGR
ncbi:NAD(P)/FAD-dependent oxidoreductase [Actinokineospora enzanensis]|uniref:NAD(P)/FAD-dependent oxidoreductase n=1 Tax=Actinokineospora enzanensis TaxID=155975 RepID=UPI00036AEFDA|nr:FAD-dependent oxidoreductase [Actinokineospora enzanensis]